MKKNTSLSFKKNTFLVSALLLAVVLACNPHEEQNEASTETAESMNPGQITLTRRQLETSAMELGTMQDHSFGTSLKINGIVDVPPEGMADISSFYGGYVSGLKLITGQAVSKGELLFSLENPEYIQMQQDFLETKSQLSYLESDFERQKTLREENIASQKNFLKAESEYLVTQARSEGLKKKLSQLNLNPEEISADKLKANIGVYAPIAGFITQVSAQNGSFLSPSDVAVTIINTDHIHLELNVFEKDIALLKKGQSINFRLPDAPGQNYEAAVFMIGKTIDEEKRMVNVHAHLKDEKQSGMLIPGMYVEAEIYSGNGVSKALPSEAVVEVAGQYFVLLKKTENSGEMVFQKTEVKIGFTGEGRTEILNAGDFNPDDSFLTRGAFNLIQ